MIVARGCATSDMVCFLKFADSCLKETIFIEINRCRHLLPDQKLGWPRNCVSKDYKLHLPSADVSKTPDKQVIQVFFESAIKSQQ